MDGDDRGRLSSKWMALALSLLAQSCGKEPRAAALRFSGQAPAGILYADTRDVLLLCPDCKAALPPGETRCARCELRLAPPAHAPCGFCKASQACEPCAVFRTAGRCRFCRGSGRLDAAACFNCAGRGDCVACAGSARCDACRGEGRLSFPWSRPALRPVSAPLSSTTPVLRAAPPLAWRGESVAISWTSSPRPASWSLFRIENGSRRAAGSALGPSAQFAPAEAGSYVAVAGAEEVCFDVLQATARDLTEGSFAAGRPLRARVDVHPPLREMRVRWELLLPGGSSRSLEGIEVDTPSGAEGRHELRFTVELPGLPPHAEPRPLAFQHRALTLVGPGPGPFPAGLPFAVRVEGVPPLPSPLTYVWKLDGPDGASTTTTDQPSAELRASTSGAHRVEVRVEGSSAASAELAIYRIQAVAAGEAPLAAVPLAQLEEQPLPQHPRRWQLVVDDAAANPPPAFVLVSTRGRDGLPLNPPVQVPLQARGRGWISSPLLLLGDRQDDARAVDGLLDDAPGDPTFLAQAGGVVEVGYRNVLSARIPVDAGARFSIPVRFRVIADSGAPIPPPDEVKRCLVRRLERVNAVWQPAGFHFFAEAVESASPAGDFLLLSGNAAGLDEGGKPGRVGFRSGEKSYAVPAGWESGRGPTTPLITAAALLEATRGEWRGEIFEQALPDDPEAVLLRLRRKDRPAPPFEALGAGSDLRQVLRPVAPDLAGGLRVGSPARILTLDESLLLLEHRPRRVEGLEVFVVGALRSAGGPAFFKAYPDWLFPETLAPTAVLDWALCDGSERYPYGLARALGELLLPPGWRPEEPRSLFADPLAEIDGPDAPRRLGAGVLEHCAERGTRRGRPGTEPQPLSSGNGMERRGNP